MGGGKEEEVADLYLACGDHGILGVLVDTVLELVELGHDNEPVE